MAKRSQITTKVNPPLVLPALGPHIAPHDNMQLAGRRVMYVRARLVEPIGPHEWVTLFEVASYRRWAVALAQACLACDDVYSEAEAITEARLLQRGGIKEVRRARGEAGSWADWELEPLILAARAIVNPTRGAYSHLTNAREQFRLAWAELEAEVLRSKDISDEQMGKLLGCTTAAVTRIRAKGELTIRFT